MDNRLYKTTSAIARDSVEPAYDVHGAPAFRAAGIGTVVSIARSTKARQVTCIAAGEPRAGSRA